MTNDPIANILISANRINEVEGSKVMEKHGSKESEIKFIIPKVWLTFAELRYTFRTALILHHFYSKYHIQTETDVSDYAI